MIIIFYKIWILTAALNTHSFGGCSDAFSPEGLTDARPQPTDINPVYDFERGLVGRDPEYVPHKLARLHGDKINFRTREKRAGYGF